VSDVCANFTKTKTITICLVPHLSGVNVFLHCAAGQQSVHIYRLRLSKSPSPEHGLQVVGWVPGTVEDNHPVCGREVDAQGASLGGDEDALDVGVGGVVKPAGYVVR
jgi:hypothetical protein